jgi:hypothetical protein
MLTGLFKSTNEIFNEAWEELTPLPKSYYKKSPIGWTKDQPMTIDDVVIWEQIYYEPGNVGIYISWSPHAEFYMIVYNLFIKCPQGIQTFYGKEAYINVLKECFKLKIELPVNTAYTDELDVSHKS